MAKSGRGLFRPWWKLRMRSDCFFFFSMTKKSFQSFAAKLAFYIHIILQRYIDRGVRTYTWAPVNGTDYRWVIWALEKSLCGFKCASFKYIHWWLITEWSLNHDLWFKPHGMTLVSHVALTLLRITAVELFSNVEFKNYLFHQHFRIQIVLLVHHTSFSTYKNYYCWKKI